MPIHLVASCNHDFLMFEQRELHTIVYAMVYTSINMFTALSFFPSQSISACSTTARAKPISIISRTATDGRFELPHVACEAAVFVRLVEGLASLPAARFLSAVTACLAGLEALLAALAAESCFTSAVGSAAGAAGSMAAAWRLDAGGLSAASCLRRCRWGGITPVALASFRTRFLGLGAAFVAAAVLSTGTSPPLASSLTVWWSVL